MNLDPHRWPVKERYSWPQVACEFEARLKEVSESHAH